MKHRFFIGTIVIFAVWAIIQSVFRINEPNSGVPTPIPGFPKPDDKAIATQTTNGITIDLINIKLSTTTQPDDSGAEVEKRVLTLDTCYSMPDAGEWTLLGQPDMLSFGNFTSNMWHMTYNLRDVIIANGRELGKRCNRYEFYFGLDVPLVSPITITFDKIVASPREWVSPCEDMMERVETNLRAREAGLVVRCEEAPNAREDYLISPGDETLTLVDYDASVLTKQEAYALMLEIESGVIYGPWIFKITPTN